MKNKLIGIYTNDENETLCHLVKTIQDGARWIGCSTTALYKSLKLDGVMNAKGYKIELINFKGELK